MINIKVGKRGMSFVDITNKQEMELRKAIKNLALVTYDDIIQIAQSELVTSRQDYIKSLKFEDFGNLYVISITEPGIYFETGFDGFDQKSYLFRHKKARRSKEGYLYNIIPFRHEPKGERGQRDTNYHQELQETIKGMQKINREIYDRSGRPIGTVVGKANKNVEGITSGLIKVRKKYKKVNQNQYLTFRVISEKSPHDSWAHPGYKGIKAFDRAEELLDERVDQIINVIFG